MSGEPKQTILRRLAATLRERGLSYTLYRVLVRVLNLPFQLVAIPFLILRNLLKRLGFAYQGYRFLSFLSCWLFDIKARETFSVFGEDLFLRDLLSAKLSPNKSPGFFVDVGCHHPTEGNNSYFFYARGWRGINLDGNADLIALYHKQRPRDISLCTLVSDQEREVDFYLMGVVSSMDATFMTENKEQWDYSKTKKLKLRTQTLTHILDQHLPKNQPIDFLSVDVEGHDLQVLQSLDFSRYLPSIIVVELFFARSIEDAKQHPITYHLTAQGYQLVYFSLISAFFEHQSHRLQRFGKF